MRTGVRIEPVAGAEDPEALTVGRLQKEIVPHGCILGIPGPPFPENPFRPVGAFHFPALTLPGEHRGRVVRQQGDDFEGAFTRASGTTPKRFEADFLNYLRFRGFRGFGLKVRPRARPVGPDPRQP